MAKNIKKGTSRRRFFSVAGSAYLLAGMAPAVFSRRASAQRKTLHILRWRNFVPAYETWFNETFVKEWGEENDTEVWVDNVGLGQINGLERGGGGGPEGA